MRATAATNIVKIGTKGDIIEASKEVVIKMGHGQDGRLYGSVTAKDIAEVLSKMVGFDIDKRKINLKDTIKAYGKYSVEIKILQDIGAKFTVTVSE